MGYVFPFGEKLKSVEQSDRCEKQVFVLGVYASAVYAKWIGPDEKVRVQALAVASEPEIFWRGREADEIINRIQVPKECGYLKPANGNLNGPSGVVLDEKFLAPLGVGREGAWLCDLLPETRLNPGQFQAIEREYLPLVQKGLVPEVTIPKVPKKFANEHRIEAIIEEIRLSNAEYLVTLGDIPLKEFVSKFDSRFTRLADFGRTSEEYGREHEITIGGRSLKLIPLVHPRQAGRLGASSMDWENLHDSWMQRMSLAGSGFTKYGGSRVY